MRPQKLRLPLKHRRDRQAALVDLGRDLFGQRTLLPMHVVQP
jgi:hypothetical protein